MLRIISQKLITRRRPFYNSNTRSGNFGVEALIDVHGCDTDLFTEDHLKEFITGLLELTDMEAVGEPVFWVSHGSEIHLNGYSVCQFVKTSSIVIHTLTDTGLLCCDLFSCKDFEADKVANYAERFFSGHLTDLRVVQRGLTR